MLGGDNKMFILTLRIGGYTSGYMLIRDMNWADGRPQ